MFLRVVLLTLAFCLSGHALAQGLKIQLGSESARFMYMTEAFGQNFGRLELEAGVLYNENNDYLLNVGLLVRGESVSVPLVVAIGARLYYADLEPYTVGAIAIGGDAALVPESWDGVSLGAYYHTAPSVVSYADAEGLTEFGVYLGYQITPQASIALGYQKIEADITGVGKRDLDNGSFFSVDLRF